MGSAHDDPASTRASESLLMLLDAQVRTRPDSTALIDEHGPCTYGELRGRWCRAAAAIHAAGVTAGDRVAVLAGNGIETAELLVACAYTGSVLVPLNVRLTAPELAMVLRSAGPRIVVVHRDLLSTAEAALSTADLPDVTVLTIFSTGSATSYESWRDTPRVLPAPRRHDVVCLTYTSGSTGGPKGVCIRHQAFTTFLPAAARGWGFDEESVGVVPLPLFHIAGLAWFLCSLLTGGAAVLLRQPDPGVIMAAVQRHGGTHINVVPALLRAMLVTQDQQPRDVSSLRTVTCGGAPIPDTFLRQAFETFGCRIVAFYGLSEAGGGVCDHELLPGYLDGEHARRLLSAGRALPDITVAVRDPATRASQPAGTTGTIVVRTPGLMAGYWEDEALTRATVDDDGWLDTGDIGYLDGEGFLYVQGRAKDVIISGGENIYAAELENVIAQCPGVREVCVVAVPDERWGETPVAVVVVGGDDPPHPPAVVAWCRDRLAHYKCPTRAVVVDELPRNATGKYDKAAVRAVVLRRR